MILAHPDFEFILDTEQDGIQTLVIENQKILRDILCDIQEQIDGKHGKVVVSSKHTPLNMNTNVEILFDVICLDLNKKSLITRIIASLEKDSAVSEKYMEISSVISQLEAIIGDMTFHYPCSIDCTKLCFSAILKAAGLKIRDDYTSGLEKLIDYMELVREFEKDKLFITVNLRSFYTDDETELFMQTADSHGFHVIMLESIDKPKLLGEKRTTIDADLCEF